jgi:hypothetical protein
VFRFSAPVYTVSEDSGQLEVTVERSGDTSVAAAVDYSTRNLTADDRSDFTTASGRLHFAPAETSKTFSVLITDDSISEGQESVQLTLDDPALGATVDQAILTLTDNDQNGSQTNAIDDPTMFVRQHYHDFLNREPDAAGLAFWTSEIEQCGQLSDLQARASCTAAKRVNVSAAFFMSIEFQQTGYLVYRMYRASLPESATRPRGLPRFAEFMRDSQAVGTGVVVGKDGWQTTLELNQQALFEDFVRRPEFLALYPESMPPDQFVDALFRTAGVTPTPAERQSVVDEFLNPAGARARVLRRVAENQVLTLREFSRAFVLMQYFGYLRRNPDDLPDSNFAGYDFWLAKLDQFGGDFVRAEMVRAFILSQEYRSRFG